MKGGTVGRGQRSGLPHLCIYHYSDLTNHYHTYPLLSWLLEPFNNISLASFILLSLVLSPSSLSLFPLHSKLDCFFPAIKSFYHPICLSVYRLSSVYLCYLFVSYNVSHIFSPLYVSVSLPFLPTLQPVLSLSFSLSLLTIS